MATPRHGYGALDRLRPLYWSLRRLIRVQTLAFFVCEHQSQLPTPDQTEIRCGGAGHEGVAERMAVLRGHDPAEYRGRLTAGHLVVYAVGSNGDVQSWGWVTAPPDGPQDAPWEFGIRMRVMPGSGFLWDYVTMPDYRGRGLYNTLLRHAAEQCFVRGAKRAWGYADTGNTASRRGLIGAGYAGRAEIKMARIGPFCWISRPGFQRTVRVGGVVDLDALLPHSL
jgi:ribosomal protein S18 acetylase RimI-like enzyme